MKQKPDEVDSMADAFGDVKRLRSDKLHLQDPRPEPVAVFTRADEREVLAESLAGDVADELETGEELHFRRQSVPVSDYRKLRRGRLSIAAEIDLHGLNAKEARERLHQFIRDASRQGLRCVRVIHGKGKRSGQRGPVLRRKVDRWLRQWSEVLAFSSARPADGGTGAAYVLLRKV